MLQVEHVSKKLGNFCLREISFHLPKGYIMGLIGLNGAGKTSLLSLMLGLYSMDEGKIFIDGLDIEAQEALAKDEIGFVLAEELFSGQLSLKANADLYGKYYSQYEKDLFLQYCQQFSLNPEKKLYKHSKGEKLKFQFAFALSHQPKLLVLDEPTANFDPEFRQHFFRILTGFIKDGEHSVILATHLTEDLDRIADYITFLNQGRLEFCMDRKELENSYRLVSGENYKINLLPKDSIICKEKGSYGTKALVKHSRWSDYDKELLVSVPAIEDIMYFILKGERGNASNRMEGL
ncbi:MAG: ABC transporter ATP-binding protein [Roseburia sp.]|nr:ABC transporter ATP-binding protein [Roseburia sp.]MCM1279890.1 ABC transporter ATP-binding protein [Robinsoniella sp.]